jgi:Histidine kinase
MEKKNRILIAHIIGSLLFLAMPIALSPHAPERNQFFSSSMMLKEFITNCLMLGFFYLNYYLLIPRLFFRKNYPVYALCIVAAFLFICTIPLTFKETRPDRFPPREVPDRFNNDLGPPIGPRGPDFLRENMYNLHLFSIVVLFSILLKVRLRLSQSEQAHYQAEVVSLKEQMNPHFLFNTLNGIYALAVRDKSNTTASAILKLSGLMRYVVTETSQVHVDLEKEISYINDYIELQKLRLDKRVQLAFEVVGSTEGKRIAPLILVPFIENAFKYGVNPDEDSSIKIRIEIVYGELTLHVVNNKVKVSMSPFEKSGKGIENTKLRLKLLYPSQYFLDISEDEKIFRVHLIIQLT